MFKKTVCILPLLYFTGLPASASVVMEGNRVILDASLAQKTVKFTNNDSFPYIVQVWLSVTPDGKEADGQQNRLAVSPAIFKIGPKQDQVISLLKLIISPRAPMHRLSLSPRYLISGQTK